MKSGPERRRWLVVYDGDCGFCKASVRWVLDRDRRGRIEARPFQEPGVLEATGISREAAEREAFLVAPDGRRWSGADAAARVLRLLPRWSLVGRVLQLPVVIQVARLAYRWIADHRPTVSRLTGVGRNGG